MKTLSRKQVLNLKKKALELQDQFQAKEITKEKATRTFERFVREEIRKENIFLNNWKKLN